MRARTHARFRVRARTHARKHILSRTHGGKIDLKKNKAKICGKMDRGVWEWEEAVSAFKQNMKAKGFWNVPGGTDKV